MSAAPKKNKANQKNLGELLVINNMVTKDALVEMQNLSPHDRWGGKMLTRLVSEGHISEDDMMNFLSEQYQCSVINVRDFDIHKSLIALVPRKLCDRHTVIPVSKIQDTLVVACANPSDRDAKEQLAFLLDAKLNLFFRKQKTFKK